MVASKSVGRIEDVVLYGIGRFSGHACDNALLCSVVLWFRQPSDPAFHFRFIVVIHLIFSVLLLS